MYKWLYISNPFHRAGELGRGIQVEMMSDCCVLVICSRCDLGIGPSAIHFSASGKTSHILYRSRLARMSDRQCGL